MSSQKTICLRCTFFRLNDVHGGVCRVDKHLSREYPNTHINDTCDRWRDCGQQYYIRLGWLKRSHAEEQGN